MYVSEEDCSPFFSQKMLSRALLWSIGEKRLASDEHVKVQVFRKPREMVDFREDWTFVDNQEEDEAHEKDGVSIICRLWSKLCEDSIRAKSVR